MTIRGWVYVLSNRAMPGLLKIGYSTKDPVLRVQELDGTGLPYPFEVEYDVLVISPKNIEQLVHLELADMREAKEFFRLSVSQAVDAISRVLESLEQDAIAEKWTNKELDDKKIAVEENFPSQGRPIVGMMKYTCRYCGTITELQTSHFFRCDYCGRTQFPS
jgi:hypothetical protein